MSWGLTGDWDLMTKLNVLRDAIARSFAELDKVARAVEAAAREEGKPADVKRQRRRLRVVS